MHRILALGLSLLLSSTALAGTKRWIIEGDTQSYSFDTSYSTPTPWHAARQWYCNNKTSKNIQGVIGTGDIIERYGSYGYGIGSLARADVDRVDYAYDITDGCGLRQVPTAGNHDAYGWCNANLPFYAGPPCYAPPIYWDRYLGFVNARPSTSAPASTKSKSGLSWIEALTTKVKLVVLPYAADKIERDWAIAQIRALPTDTFFILQHEAVDPSYLPSYSTGTAAGYIANLFGPKRIPLVIGGHFFAGYGGDRVMTGVNSAGTRSLLVNFQEDDPNTGDPFFGNVVWLTTDTATGRWCFWDDNVTHSGQTNRFEATTCFTPDADGDGVANALDNCPYYANSSQTDTGGVGSASGPDGIGDACQCGDVNASGRVTGTDAISIDRALVVPKTATMTRPNLCDVNRSSTCSSADSIIIKRALLVPSTGTIAQQCASANP